MSATTAQQERSEVIPNEGAGVDVEEASDDLLKLLGDGDEDLTDEEAREQHEQDDLDGEREKRRKKKRKPADDVDEGEEEEDEEEDEDSVEDADEDADPNDAEDEEADDDDDNDEEIEVFTVKVNGKDEDVTPEELVAGYSRTADYTRKTQQLAKDREAVDAEHAETREVRSNYLATLKLMNKSLDDLNPEPDWAKRKLESPTTWAEEHAEHQIAQGKRQKLKDEEASAQKEHDADLEVAQKKYYATERAALHKALPVLADEEKGAALEAEMAAYAEQRFGVNREAFNNVANHHILVLLHDAMELSKLKDGTKKLRRKRVKKGRTRVLNPGARPQGSVRRKTVRKSKAAAQRLAQTGSLSDATAAFLDLEDE